MTEQVRSQTAYWIVIGAFSAAIAIAMGAFGAHGLKPFLAETVEDPVKNLATWETGSRYHIYHSIAVVLVGLSISQLGVNRWFNWAATLFVFGLFVFSGLLYTLAVTDIKILGAIVPLGGLSFIVGWILFGVGALVSKTLTKVPE
ncbi:MAG: DUF423 domain-containing protein [Planctomycetota bacterium]